MTDHGPALPLLSAYLLYAGAMLAGVVAVAATCYLLFPPRHHRRGGPVTRKD